MNTPKPSIDWKTEMIEKVQNEIQLWMETGLSRSEAIRLTKENTIAGPKVWEAIEV